MIFTQLIQTNLRTKELGKNIEYYNRLDSTNIEAWELINEENNHGTIVITDNQSNGKARNNNSWEMITGKGLAFSLIINKNFPSKLSGLLPILSGVAVIDSLKMRGVDAKLKWPNDIYFESKKLGGILCESKVLKNKIIKTVIGIGINVNEKSDEHSDEINNTLTTMSEITNHAHQRELIVSEFINSIEKNLNLFVGNSTLIVNEWLNHCCHINQKIVFSENGKNLEGVFIGINNHGHARVKTNNKIESYNSITIKIIE